MKTQQYPSGYLSLLNAKSNGYTPPDVVDSIRPTLDITQFLKASIPLTSKANSTPAQSAVGAGTTLTVPNGEAWQVIAAAANASLGTAGNVLKFKLTLNPPDLSLSSCALSTFGPLAVTNAGEIFSCCWSAPDGFIVGPGTQFQMQLMLALANTVTASVVVLYRPLLV